MKLAVVSFDMISNQAYSLHGQLTTMFPFIWEKIPDSRATESPAYPNRCKKWVR